MMQSIRIKNLKLSLILVSAVMACSALTAVFAAPKAAAATVTVDSLNISPLNPKPTDNVQATAVIRSDTTITLQALTIAVRNESNGNFDFPGAINNVTIGTTPYTFKPNTRTFPQGNYTYFVAYQYNNVWTNLNPVKFMGSYPFHDEFETTGTFDHNIWYVDPCWQVNRCGNNELQEYADENCWTDGNNLVMAAWSQSDPNYPYQSCRLTMFNPNNNNIPSWSKQYGHFEARIMMPSGQGLWPAFWMEGSNKGTVGWPLDGEIDVMEAKGQEPNKVHQYMHGGNPYYKRGGEWTFPLGQNINGWHTYSVDWNATSITWKVDGTTVRTVTKADVGAAAWEQSFDHPFSLIVNMAVGGTFAGPTVDPAAFPAYMKVAWIRVW